MKRKLICTNYFIILEKNNFQERTPKTQMLMFGLAQTSHFGLWDIIPPEFQLAFHIYYVKYENTCAKGLVGTRGDIFLFPICIIQKVTILAPK